MFAGTYTALVTPFTENGGVDFDALHALIEGQIEAGIDGIVPLGTTGESPTVPFDEHQEVIAAAVRIVDGRCAVIAGTGGNSTDEAVMLTREAKEAGADATLQVAPYYNKPSQEGLFRHFSQIADIGLPVVLYNIPGRTSCEIQLDTIIRLADHPHIHAIKEATGNVDNVSLIRHSCELDILSGDDALTLPMMVAGASGVISVTSNLVPGPMVELTHAANAGDWKRARELHDHYHRLFTDLFIETNPIPIKAALAMRGLIEETYRLPMCEMSKDNRAVLAATMRELGLI